MKVSGFVNCSDGTSGQWDSGSFVNATDNYQIPAGAFSGYTGDCIITIAVENSIFKTADPAFRPGSYIQSHQYRTLAVATID
jgi:hypothetical protein